MSERTFFSELKRRNVFKASAAYLALGWVVTQITATVAPMMHLPEWIGPVVLWIGIIGFPFLVMFSWVYEITPEGIKRESEVVRDDSITHVTARRLDYAIVGLLVLAVGLFAVDRFVVTPRREAARPSEVATPAADKAAGQPAAPAPRAASQASIAVLPFADMSQAKDQEYFSDGISEELLNLLAKIPQLQVAARTSSFSFKGQNVEIPEIARRLNVAHVLEGSIRTSGDQLRITAQLVRASDGFHLWSETYDRKLDDIFKIQDEISGKVVEQLKVTLLGAAPKARATNPEAYALFLRAVQVGRQNTAAAYTQSDALLRKALAIDPRYAPAWGELARNFSVQASQGQIPVRTGLAQAREHAETALAIDPDLATAHARLGLIALDADSDLRKAAAHLGRALALEPSNLDVLRTSALLVAALGRLEPALAINEAIVRRDPVNVTAHFNLGLYQRYAGRFDASIASHRTVLELSPGRGNTHGSLSVTLLMKGDATGALAEGELEPVETWKMVALPMALHALGRKADSDAALQALIAKYEKEMTSNIAYILAFRGEADRAFEWLDKAVAYGDPGISEVVLEPLFAPIRSDARWLPFLRRIGKAPEQLAEIEFEVKLPAEWEAEAAPAPASGGSKS